MADIRCAKCLEPWDAYGVRHGEMTERESELFLRGEGCPCCNFGRDCPNCMGTGKEPEEYPSCEHCYGKGYMNVRRLLNAAPGTSDEQLYLNRWIVGYEPNMVEIAGPQFLPGHEASYYRCCLERLGEGAGRVEQRWAYCDRGCHDLLDPCTRCGGTGRLDPDEDDQLAAARDELDASDEDPALILQRRGLL